MKICVAQTRPVKGDVQKNVLVHQQLILLAAKHAADIVMFPELSLTGYEPSLIQELATNQHDPLFDAFQRLSEEHKMMIAVGMPTRHPEGIRISMIVTGRNGVKQTYSKRFLHEDELPYFTQGKEQIFLETAGTKIAPAICYESLLPEHIEYAASQNSKVYLTSVAKTIQGVEKAANYYAAAAKKYGMTIAMSNCTGVCDNFESVGNSAVWNDRGELVAQMNNTDEGILVFDTDTESIVMETI